MQSGPTRLPAAQAVRASRGQRARICCLEIWPCHAAPSQARATSSGQGRIFQGGRLAVGGRDGAFQKCVAQKSAAATLVAVRHKKAAWVLACAHAHLQQLAPTRWRLGAWRGAARACSCVAGTGGARSPLACSQLGLGGLTIGARAEPLAASGLAMKSVQPPLASCRRRCPSSPT